MAGASGGEGGATGHLGGAARGSEVFRGGFIMPHIDAEGRVYRERPMGTATSCVPAARAGLCHGHVGGGGGALRRAFGALGRGFGGGSERPTAASNCHLAGVKDINWLVGYMREGVSDRLRASWAVGLLSYDTPALSTTSRRLFEDIVCVLDCVSIGGSTLTSRAPSPRHFSDDLWAPLVVEF